MLQRKTLRLTQIQDSKLQYLLQKLEAHGLNLELGINEPQCPKKLAALFINEESATSSPLVWLFRMYEKALEGYAQNKRDLFTETLASITKGTLHQNRLLMLHALKDFVYLGADLECITTFLQRDCAVVDSVSTKQKYAYLSWDKRNLFSYALTWIYPLEQRFDQQAKSQSIAYSDGNYLVTLLPQLPTFDVNAHFYSYSDSKFTTALAYALGCNSEKRIAPLEVIQSLLNSPELNFQQFGFDLYQNVVITNHFDAIKLLINYGVQIDESSLTTYCSEEVKRTNSPLTFDTVQLLMQSAGDLNFPTLAKIFGPQLNVLARIGIVNELITAQMFKELLPILKKQANEEKLDLQKELELRLAKMFNLTSDSSDKDELFISFVTPVIEFAKTLEQTQKLEEIKETQFAEALKESKLTPHLLLNDKHPQVKNQTALEYFVSADNIYAVQILLMFSAVRDHAASNFNAIKLAIRSKNLKALFLLITQVDFKNPIEIFIWALDPRNYQQSHFQFAVLTVLLKRMEIRHAIPDQIYITLLKKYFYQLPPQTINVLFKFF